MTSTSAWKRTPVPANFLSAVKALFWHLFYCCGVCGRVTQWSGWFKTASPGQLPQAQYLSQWGHFFLHQEWTNPTSTKADSNQQFVPNATKWSANAVDQWNPNLCGFLIKLVSSGLFVVKATSSTPHKAHLRMLHLPSDRMPSWSFWLK